MYFAFTSHNNKNDIHLPKDPNEKICCNPNIHQLQSQKL